MAQLPDHDRPPDGYVMVVLYDRTGQEIERWGGPIDLHVDRPARYRANRSGKRWLWREVPSQHLRVKAPTRTSGKAGQEVTRWATSRKAARLVVVVVPYPGGAEKGASRTGLGTRGQGQGWDVSRRMRTAEPPVHDPRVPVSDVASTGLGEVGDGLGRGPGRGDHDATGTSAHGTRRGVSIGGEDPSWVNNPRAQLAKRGGRTPADGGKAKGSAEGKAGGGGNISGAGWFNLLDVPESVAPAVAAMVILLEADVLGFAQKLLNRVLRRLVGNLLEAEIERQARAAVKRHKEVARARMASVKNPPSAAHLDEVMEYMPEEMLLAYYRQLARVARERKALHRATVARTDGLTGEVSEYTHELARQNANAWGAIEHAAQRRLAAEEAAAAQRAAPKGGRGPVLVGLKGEEAVRAVVDIGKPKKIRINGRWRIPDGIQGKVLSEVKNVKKLSFRTQLRDYWEFCKEHGYRFDLYIRRDTQLSKPLAAAIRRKEIILKYIP